MTSNVDSSSEPARLPYFSTFHNPLFEIIETILNTIDRKTRPELEARAKGLRVFCLSHLRVARKTFETIEALVYDRKELALGIEVAVSLPPLTRVILESTFTITYIFDDPTNRLPFFWHTSWVALATEHHQYTSDYGSRPEWQDWLKQLQQQRDDWRDQLQAEGTPLPQEWLTDLSKARKKGRWPNPGKMPKDCKDSWRKDILSYLNMKFYGHLSMATHLAGTGMSKQAGLFIPNVEEQSKSRLLDNYLIEAMTVMLTLVSQYTLDVTPDRNLATRIMTLWRTSWLPPLVGEVYENWYENKLNAL